MPIFALHFIFSKNFPQFCEISDEFTDHILIPGTPELG